ncbi:hypothetical protein Vafri_20804, partial [Volvox africanus]
IPSCASTGTDLIADQKGLPREKVKSWTPYAGGAPCNVATAAARLGLDVTFVTALGDDEWAKKLLDVCRERGVQLHAVQRPKGRRTRDVYVVRDVTGDREFAGFGLPGTGQEYADAFIDPEALPLEELQVGSGGWEGETLGGAGFRSLPMQLPKGRPLRGISEFRLPGLYDCFES